MSPEQSRQRRWALRESSPNPVSITEQNDTCEQPILPCNRCVLQRQLMIYSIADTGVNTSRSYSSTVKNSNPPPPCLHRLLRRVHPRKCQRRNNRCFLWKACQTKILDTTATSGREMKHLKFPEAPRLRKMGLQILPCNTTSDAIYEYV